MTIGSGKQNSAFPAEDFYPVTPDNANDLAVFTRAICLAVGGDVKVHKLDGTAVTLTLPAGVIPIRVRRIWSIGTTATGITALV
ncbi:hypothetical protein [Caulobacter sp. CCG-8]|uniref:spike base protein, RCAP_Rcc01079 family n=1 Tax=Caulobacter sp. CCG-8 TaxID=3127958 RepID=UPI00307E632E